MAKEIEIIPDIDIIRVLEKSGKFPDILIPVPLDPVLFFSITREISRDPGTAIPRSGRPENSEERSRISAGYLDSEKLLKHTDDKNPRNIQISGFCNSLEPVLSHR